MVGEGWDVDDDEEAWWVELTAVEEEVDAEAMARLEEWEVDEAARVEDVVMPVVL